jgi:guanylate kinase
MTASIGKYFLILGPSGVGKSTLIEKVLADYKCIHYEPSYTTRTARPGEIHKVHYYFVDDNEFQEMIQKNMFIEIDQPHGTYCYGISKQPIFKNLSDGISYIKEIGANGLQTILNSEIGESVVSIFFEPENMEELIKRLFSRDKIPSKERIRMLDEEMKYRSLCSHRISIRHGDLEHGYQQLASIISSYIQC